MTSDKSLLIIAVIAVIVSGVVLVMTYSNLFAFERILLAPSGTGTVEVTITENAEVTFTTALINWGAGFIPTDDGAETLDTEVGTASLPNGHWNRASNLPQATSGGDDGSGGFVMENTGNSNVELRISGNKDADSFIGGTSPSFEYKMIDDPSEPLACPVINQVIWNTYTAVGTTTPGDLVCNRFLYDNFGSDLIQMHIKVVVPENAALDSSADTTIITADIVGVA